MVAKAKTENLCNFPLNQCYACMSGFRNKPNQIYIYALQYQNNFYLLCSFDYEAIILVAFLLYALQMPVIIIESTMTFKHATRFLCFCSIFHRVPFQIVWC